MKILYAASEAVPFCKTGGLADVAGSLPEALAAQGAEVAVVLPFYFSGSMAQANYDKGFAVSVLLLVGLGTVVHSMVDCWLAQVIYKPVSHMPQVKQIAAVRL